ncbi:MAG TPA: sigma-70 family RNA polymerase sigma factor [Tepidisphaeraceae bacterium]|nr:sigma-70 family RNA polymerase sigma factor [Tepidisphaeraceae bacterium]
MEPTWEEVVRRAQRRDAAAFARLIARHERTALALAYGLLADPNSAGDVVQDAFVRAWERLADLKEPARFGPWLCGIVRNMAIDALRRSRHEPRAGSQTPEVQDAHHPLGFGDCPDPADELARRERDAALSAAIESLDEVSRSAVVLRYYDGLSSKQIGDLLDLAPAAVDMRLTRARRQLRQRLNRMQNDECRMQNAE